MIGQFVQPFRLLKIIFLFFRDFYVQNEDVDAHTLKKNNVTDEDNSGGDKTLVPDRNRNSMVRMSTLSDELGTMVINSDTDDDATMKSLYIYLLIACVHNIYEIIN